MKTNLSKLWIEAREDTNREAFASDWALSSIWGEEEADLIDRTEWIGRIWDAAHRTVREIVSESGLSQRAFAAEIGAPVRTVEDWCRGISSPPDYVRMLLQEHFDMI